MRKIRDEYSTRTVRDSRRKDKAETLRRKQIRQVKQAQPVAA
ncbi:hypothetical protein FDI80_gp69 [Streptomyces phage Aaronocolus]|uniref:Uncharacterized protein n=10 Tax=Likavirus TaxID=1982880 RepID=A0A411CVL8_9CAUD|nr:hypothetical protein FDI80_gp69 [Streptomyces phage Aaronocolus]YP_009616570.1 hypothetical protein FDI81_gp72 [Streptomyces phage Hydra]ATE84948.1 hypothetical protein SEA_BEARDEDLADY_70 [Streptomyces phage BeardedLady]ATE85250.1 hypothetical protein SEA_ESPERER_70 [Streptomyces phage Esperer]ATE85473.1 hypothetical protein SEA_OZZIE_69 [Streptomyces phage Ozzie]QAY17272.1 hypothetical protein SEA_BOVELY_69 [Streptomyces phage Bovely]QAY17344.1 hypothetical protein SEA_INDIGO_68 [Streptom